MLEVKNLSVRYGRHQALDRVSVTVAKGEVCVILGANGAGKSSLLKAIAGTVRVEPGSEIVMNGKPIVGMKAHLIVEQGVALVPEGRGIFGELTVAENLRARRIPQSRAGPRARDARPDLDAVSASRRTALPGGAHDVRRRAADGRDRPRTDVAAGNPDAGRAVARAVAGADQGAVPFAGQDRRDRRRHPAGRAERAAEPEDRRSRLSDRSRPDHRRGHGAKPDDRSGGGERLSRRRTRREGKATAIRLPAPFPLPLDLASVGRFIGASGAARRCDPGRVRAGAASVRTFAERVCRTLRSEEGWRSVDRTRHELRRAPRRRARMSRPTASASPIMRPNLRRPQRFATRGIFAHCVPRARTHLHL